MENEILQQILSELKSMRTDISDLKQGQAKLEQGQAKLEQGQEDLRAEMNARFDNLEYGMQQAFKDIGIVEDRIKQHEKEFHKVG